MLKILEDISQETFSGNKNSQKIIEKSLKIKMDVWTAAVILVVALSGKFVFDHFLMVLKFWTLTAMSTYRQIFKITF